MPARPGLRHPQGLRYYNARAAIRLTAQLVFAVWISLPDLGRIPRQDRVLPAGDRAIRIRPALHLVMLLHLVTDPGSFAGADA